MKKLKDILNNVDVVEIKGDQDQMLNAIEFDSRKVSKNIAFVAIQGDTVDGHRFIDGCIEQGCNVVVFEHAPDSFLDDVTYVQVVDTKEALGVMASNFYDHPSKKIKLVGVTGTNGKTTCATLLQRLFMEMGYGVGLLSTIENKINETIIPSTHTTPDAVQLNALLARMVKEGCTHCFMEVSSHAVVQRRIAGLTFEGAVFTNISHDHLDYHETFDEYIKAKKRFFDDLGKDAFALVNADDKRGMVMLQNCAATHHTFSLRSISDFKAKILTNSFEGLELSIDGTSVWFKLIGEFNAYNLLTIYAVATILEEDTQEVLGQMSNLETASGRFDYFIGREKITAIVDYAHTPDALENVLKTIQTIRTGNEKLITVVGCGGNRDKTKRPKMAGIAAKYSDQTVLTSDNPRNEEPEEIIKDMKQGLTPVQARKTLSITNREEGIRTACTLANARDIILVAGKGHEDYQEINGVKHHFDDKEILKEFLNQA